MLCSNQQVEKGYLHPKHSVNTMVKNVVDIVVGGAMFWLFGYGVAFGGDSTSFMGRSDFFFQPPLHKKNLAEQTDGYANWIFHFAFASTATTIVSGSVAGRVKMASYTLWAFFAPLFYAFVAHWVWAEYDDDTKPWLENQINKDGWLFKMGFRDFAGGGPVHLFGACGSLVGICLIGPRLGRFNLEERKEQLKEIYEPESVIAGTLVLWWGWIGFNCGSTFGTTGIKGAIAARVGVVTVVATVAGAMTEFTKIFLPSARKRVNRAGSLLGHKIEETKVGIGAALKRGVSMKSWRVTSMPTSEEIEMAMKRKMEQKKSSKEATDCGDAVLEERPSMVNRRSNSYDRIVQRRDSIMLKVKKRFEVTDNRIKVPALTNAILSALVSITAPCNCVNPRSAVIIGAFAPFISSFVNKKIEEAGLDDPCGAIGVHGASGIWGLICVGLFSNANLPDVKKNGLFYSWDGDGAEYLGIQLLGVCVIASWGVATNYMLFNLVKYLTGGLRVDLLTEEIGLDHAEHSAGTLLGTALQKIENREKSRSVPLSFNPMAIHDESSMLDVMFTSGVVVEKKEGEHEEGEDSGDEEEDRPSRVKFDLKPSLGDGAS